MTNFSQFIDSFYEVQNQTKPDVYATTTTTPEINTETSSDSTSTSSSTTLEQIFINRKKERITKSRRLFSNTTVNQSTTSSEANGTTPDGI